MSILKLNGVQIGQSLTAANNFTWYQPATPDGTVRFGNGNAGSVTDILTCYSNGNIYSSNTITASAFVGSFSGSGASLTSIPNSSLTNSSVTINGSSVSLGGTVTIAAGATITDDTTTNASRYVMLGQSTSGSYTVANTSSTKLTYNPSTGTLSATSFVGSFSGSGASLTSIPNGALVNSSLTINGTAISLGSSGTVTAAAGTLTGTTLASGVTASSLTSVGTITSGTWSGSFGAVSGASLTSLTAGNLSGTIPSGVLGNSTHYVGTTAIALNRSSASQTLTGVSIDGNAANITAYTINQNVGSSNSPTFAGITTSGNITRNAAGVGWLSGNYGTAETGSTTHAIYSIGGSYYPTSSSLNNMYGIGYCASTTFSGFSVPGWGLYVASGGTSRHFFDSDNGNSYSSASKRAPIFYDSNDTGYYIDPNSTGVTALRVRGGAVFGPNNTWGAYLQVGGNTREYVDNASYASVATSDGNLHMDAASAHSMYLNFYDGSNIYFGNGAGGYNAYVNSSGNGYFPIIYDNNDTGYYTDPASTSSTNHIIASRIKLTRNYGHSIFGVYDSTRYQGVWSMGESWYLPDDGTTTGNLYGLSWSHPNAGGVAANLNDHGLLVLVNGGFRASVTGSIRCVSDMRTPIYYDSNDTYYYNDLNSSRRFAGRTYIHEWIEFVNYTGLYSPNNGAHFYPNNSTYGSWRCDGSRNGWQGIEFTTHTTLMMNDDAYGFHKQGTGWRFYVTGGSGHFPGNVTAYWSDRRLKENLRPIGKEATDILSQLTTYRFNWNKKVKEFNLPIEVGKEEIGLIAQDVQKVLPDAVVVNKSANTLSEDGTTNEKDYLTINWDKITPLLVQSLNDTIKELNELKQKLKDNGII